MSNLEFSVNYKVKSEEAGFRVHHRLQDNTWEPVSTYFHRRSSAEQKMSHLIRTESAKADRN